MRHLYSCTSQDSFAFLEHRLVKNVFLKPIASPWKSIFLSSYALTAVIVFFITLHLGTAKIFGLLKVSFKRLQFFFWCARQCLYKSKTTSLSPALCHVECLLLLKKPYIGLSRSAKWYVDQAKQLLSQKKRFVSSPRAGCTEFLNASKWRADGDNLFGEVLWHSNSTLCLPHADFDNFKMNPAPKKVVEFLWRGTKCSFSVLAHVCVPYIWQYIYFFPTRLYSVDDSIGFCLGVFLDLTEVCSIAEIPW